MPQNRLATYCKLSLMMGCSLYGLAATAALAQTPPTTSAPVSAEEPQVVTVVGSRIPRVRKEGPAPVTVITSDQIRAGGFANVPDVLKTLTQNSGETQSMQSGNAADYSPGAQQVNLRGLGPNHTLVMVNGRRVADYPMPYNGDSNFTDISNIPLGMVDAIEVLSGSASAIYGSDALAGVVNFKLKQHADGTTFDYRYGWTEQGGGASHRFNASSGFDFGKFHGVFGGEVMIQDPVYGYQRKRQDSTADAPDPAYQMGVTNWLRVDYDVYAINPSAADCARTASTNGGTTTVQSDPYYDGTYCGSQTAQGYRTVVSDRKSANFVGSFTYDLNDNTHLFLDAQVGFSKLKLLKRPLSWGYQDADGNDVGDFYNAHASREDTDNWYRIFTPEEMGGLDRAMRTVDSKTITLTPGIRGTFAEKWTYEAAISASAYNAKVTFPMINAAKANALFLGPQLGMDTDDAYLGEDDGYGLPVFNANPTRFYTPLTPAEFESIREESVYKPRSSVVQASLQLGTQELFQMPAGPVGFSAIIETGRQNFNQGTDPKATQPYYFSWVDFTSKGHRTHAAAAVEFSVPLLSTLQSNLAARYDTFDYAGNSVAETTYNIGLEYRPVDTLLFRAAWGTGFRAPDLNYVYRGTGFEEGRATDYYQCIQDGDYPSDCGRGPRIRVRTGGNLKLEPETSESFNTGFVWAPSRAFDISVDYFKIDMKGQVEDLLVNNLTRTEGECRAGLQNINTPTCQDAIARVTRDSDGDITQVFVSPINVSVESTSGVDLSAHARLQTPIGKLSLTGNYTHTIDHDYTRYVGDPAINKLANDSSYYIPRNKASITANLEKGAWSFNLSGNHLSRLPNYDENAWVGSYTTYNGSAQYKVNDKVRVSLAITNLFDKKPPSDTTWVSYPYYNTSWYDGIGRSGFLQVTYKLD
jgi:outer membrane receptor protein involved in Fe transport